MYISWLAPGDINSVGKDTAVGGSAGAGWRDRGDLTYVLSNAAGLPAETVDDLAEGATVVQPAHGALKLGPQHRDGLASPDGAQDVPL